MNCSNLCVRGSGLSFYTFPADLDRRNKWIAAVNRKNWYPTEHTVICSEHFIDGQKSNNQFAPNSTVLFLVLLPQVILYRYTTAATLLVL